MDTSLMSTMSPQRPERKDFLKIRSNRLEKKERAFHACLMEFGWAPLTEAPAAAHADWRIRSSGNRTDVTFPRALIVACAVQGIELNVGAQIISELKMFYRVRQGSTSRSKIRITDKASSSKKIVDSDDEDGDGTSPTPLSGARVEEDLTDVWTALEVEMLRRELRQERRKGLERDRLLVRIWKTLGIIFTCVALDRRFFILIKEISSTSPLWTRPCPAWYLQRILILMTTPPSPKGLDLVFHPS
uniref:Uncharacterized protein n=1 Tax=Solanum tuberosum TaxID=4113 RepID=M0ZYH2_SOLTU